MAKQIETMALAFAEQWPAIITSGWGKGEVGTVTKRRESCFGREWFFVHTGPGPDDGHWKVPGTFEEQPDEPD